MNPFELFEVWYNSAKAEMGDEAVNVMCLATATKDGRPSVRAVLLKGYGCDGFTFFTNLNSRKGREIAENRWAALVFYWHCLKKQIRIEGCLERISDAESDICHASRPRGSQASATCSRQSDVLESWDEFEKEVLVLMESEGEIPRPPFWGGLRVKPHTIEFWEDGVYRMHRRIRYGLSGNVWIRENLYP